MGRIIKFTRRDTMSATYTITDVEVVVDKTGREMIEVNATNNGTPLKFFIKQEAN